VYFEKRTAPLLLLLLLALLMPAPVAALSTEVAVQIAAGLREDRLDWSISGSTPYQGAVRPARSELTWDNLRIRQIQTQGTMTLTAEGAPRIAARIRGEAGYGRIHSGSNQDSDFVLVDNQVIEFSRSNNNADRGHVLDLSVGGGLQFRPIRRIAFTPLLGYSYHEQNLRISDGFQSIDTIAQQVGPFAGLDSRYETEWRGPWLGLEVQGQLLERLSLSATFQHHWADFQAEADWNLRDKFQHPVSFTQAANATGITVSTAAAYELTSRWLLELSYDYRRWQTAGGIHRFFFVDSGAAAVRLNEVNWKSQALMLGLTRQF
jgi:opacity protein-like surface antigen